MNFQNLEYFIEVASERNITKAAENLNISQQALSSNISRLEQELGCSLFDRQHNMELTYSGRKFYASCIKMLDMKRQTTAEIDDINSNLRGELRIGISFTRGLAILPLVLPQFSNMYPNVELQVTEGSTAVLEDRLSKGLIDVMIGFSPFMVNCATSYPLMEDSLYLIIPYSLAAKHFSNGGNKELSDFTRNHDISVFKDLPFVLLKKGDRIRTIADENFRRAGITPIIKLETESTQTAFALAAQGMGITVCPQLYLESPYLNSGNKNSTLRSKVACIPFFKENVTDTIAIGFNKDRYLSRFAEDFIRLCQQILPRHNTMGEI